MKHMKPTYRTGVTYMCPTLMARQALPTSPGLCRVTSLGASLGAETCSMTERRPRSHSC